MFLINRNVWWQRAAKRSGRLGADLAQLEKNISRNRARYEFSSQTVTGVSRFFGTEPVFHKVGLLLEKESQRNCLPELQSQAKEKLIVD